jgi:DNA-binding NarL/FixJ family response regulator
MGGRSKGESGPVPRELRAARLRLDDEDVVVLSFGSPVNDSSSVLTAAERAVFDRLLAGDSNLAIAERRGVSKSTIANQVASIFQKLHVGSRAELVRKVGLR